MQLLSVTSLLFAINTCLFVWMSWQSGGVWIPETQVLLGFGARDPILVAQGEWWRLFSAGFLHIGVIHFVVNQMALKYLGPHIEDAIGKVLFLAIYLVCIASGNIAGGLWSFSIGAGASSALFGLLGVGCFFEHGLGLGVKGPFWRMFWMNGGLGFIIPGLDQAAHLGGWIFGYAAGAVILSWRGNRLWARRRWMSLLLAFSMAALFVGAWKRSENLEVLVSRLDVLWDKRDLEEEGESYKILTDKIRLHPNQSEEWLQRGAWFLENNYFKDAFRDFSRVVEIDGDDDKLQLHYSWLKSQNKYDKAMRLDVLRAQIMKLQSDRLPDIR